jgi:hypothetical protein
VALLQTIKHEVKQVGLITLYFLFCFGIILWLKKLFLAQYEVEYYALSAAVVGALVIGKVVIILDKTRLGNRFEGQALYKDILYRSFVYTLVVILVLFAEHVFHARHEAGGIVSAAVDVFQHRDADHLLATIVCVSMSFIGYNVISAISRHLGEGELVRLFFSANMKSEK